MTACCRWLQQIPVYLHSSIFGEVWFQNLVLIVSAAIAILTLRSSSRHERRRATVDVVLDQLKDESLTDARLIVRNLKNALGGIDSQTILIPADSPTQQAFFTVLNSYEFMATGLKTGAFDKKTYKRMYYTNVVDNWNVLKDFVFRYREKYRKQHGSVAGRRSETIFQDFENLAEKWKKRPLRADHGHTRQQ